MDKILSKDTIKNVFSALGAKTSDSNYGVALLDKTSGEPKGLMGMSDLASVLGVELVKSTGEQSDANNYRTTLPGKILYAWHTTGGSNYPEDWGLLRTIKVSDVIFYQWFYCVDGSVYMRTYSSNTWSAWKTIAS